MKGSFMSRKIVARKLMFIFALTVFAVILPKAVHAASGLPWEEPLDKILDSLEGPVAKIIGTICVITTGLALSFGEMGGAARKGIQIVFGLSIAYFATTFISTLFGK